MITAERHSQLPALHLYQPNYALRILVVSAVVGGVLAALIATGQCDGLSRWILPAHQWKILLTAEIAVLFITTTCLIVHKAKQGLASGHLVGSSHWKQCFIMVENQFYVAHLDMSHVETKTGVARFYFKTPEAATHSAVLALLFMPIYITVVVVYNILRFFVIPFYMFRQEHASQDPSQRKWTLMDFLKEMARSLQGAFQAPFYGVAMACAAFYTLIDPMNGIKLGGAIEADWNNQIPLRYKGYWLIAGRAFKDWKPEWRGGNFGENAIYYAGSWQPYRELHFANGLITKITLLNDTEVDPEEEGYTIEFLSQEQLNNSPYDEFKIKSTATPA